MLHQFCASLTLLALVSLSSQTAATVPPWSLSPVISTLDAGLEFGYHPYPLWGVRLSATMPPLPDKLTLNRVTYRVDGASPSLGLLSDVFPWRNGFHFSAGLYRFHLKNGHFLPDKF